MHKKKEIIVARTDPPAKKPVRFSRDRTGDVAKWIPRLPPEQKIPSSNLGILNIFKFLVVILLSKDFFASGMSRTTSSFERATLRVERQSMGAVVDVDARGGVLVC